MLVTRTIFNDVLAKLSVPGMYVLDTETTGLDPYLHGDSPFAIIITTLNPEDPPWYFNFIPYEEWGEDQEDKVLSKPHKDALKKVLDSKFHTWIGHNMKFDCHMLRRFGLYPRNYLCTMVRERILKNDRMSLSLANITGEKSDAVRKHVLKHKLYTDRPKVFGSGKDRRMRYDKVPPDLMIPYAEQDVVTTRDLYLDQEARLARMEKIRQDRTPNTQSIQSVLELERCVLPVVQQMEVKGLYVDRAYGLEAYQYELERAKRARDEFKRLSGVEYQARDAVLGPIFEAEGFVLGRTADNRYALDASVLKSMNNALATSVLEVRDAEKRANTFWAGIMGRLDKQNRLHADFKPAGTATGRFSCSDPNMQNFPKRRDENAKYPIRKAFVPPPGYALFMPDFEQMEYRLFMDLAGQMDVIESVLKGTDVHSATAELIGRDRSVAKMVNFLLIYGGGNAKLANAIDVNVDEATRIRTEYLAKLPKVNILISRLREVAKARGWIINWHGRPLRFNSETYYKAPNHYIQGGCADIVKSGMVRCEPYLRRRKSYMCNQIHDEVWFYVHESELPICEELVGLLETAYPFKYLPMAVDPSHSWVSAHDKEAGCVARKHIPEEAD